MAVIGVLLIQAISPCPDYRYSLHLEDSDGNRLNQTISTSGPVVNFSINGLMENVHYLYYVMASNQFGDSNMSALVEISE